MYLSFTRGGNRQFMHVAESDSPLGPFVNEKMLYHEFSIDSHVVETAAGLFLFYAKNKRVPDYEGDRIGTRIFVDRLIDPYTPAYAPVEAVVPDFDEEIYTPNYSESCRWHTIEGGFWFKDGRFNPIIFKNAFEEGTGHHSIIKHNGEYYAFYHGRDIGSGPMNKQEDTRTARVCKLKMDNGVLRAEMKENDI